ncbi:hypothetical protein, partial [Acinetobacter lactucae]|uniref:hypothetical protein n=1 Tax=Acinetobacter lactucae TaxID=1785128 RepID=UPI001C2E52D2
YFCQCKKSIDMLEIEKLFINIFYLDFFHAKPSKDSKIVPLKRFLPYLIPTKNVAFLIIFSHNDY